MLVFLQAFNSLVSEFNMEVTSSGIAVQAMDTSHVCLISLELDGGAFDPFRCDKNMTLGVSTSK